MRFFSSSVWLSLLTSVMLSGVTAFANNCPDLNWEQTRTKILDEFGNKAKPDPKRSPREMAVALLTAYRSAGKDMAAANVYVIDHEQWYLPGSDLASPASSLQPQALAPAWRGPMREHFFTVIDWKVYDPVYDRMTDDLTDYVHRMWNRTDVEGNRNESNVLDKILVRVVSAEDFLRLNEEHPNSDEQLHAALNQLGEAKPLSELILRD